MLPIKTVLITITSTFFVAPFLALVLLLSLPAIVLVFGINSIVRLLAWYFRPDLNGMVKGMNSVFTSKTPTNIIFTLGFKGSVTTSTVRKCFETRLLSLKDPKEVEVDYYKGLTRRWVSFLGFAFWRRETEFDLRSHIRDYDYGGKLALSEKCTYEDVQRVLGGLGGVPWDSDMSPWELLIIPNYEGRDGSSPGSALIVRINHILLDGFGVLRMLKELTQSSFKVPEPKQGTRDFSVWKSLGLMLKFPWDLAHTLTVPFYYSPIQENKKFSKEEVQVSFSPEINVKVVKKIKNHFGVSYAAVTYAALFGALGKALKISGARLPSNVVVGFVLPAKERSEGIEMNLTVMVAVWPILAGTPEERLRTIHGSLKTMSQSTAALAIPTIVNTGAYLPIFVRESLCRSLTSRLSLGITSFPVTSERDYFEGCEIVESFGGLGSWAELRCLSTIAGLNNKQTFTFSINRSFLDSEESVLKLGSYVEQELQSLLDSTV